MKQQSQDVVSEVYTYTYTEKEETPMEVLLVGVNTDKLGDGNSLKPHGFNIEHITSWLRQRYFFVGGVAYAQVPRKIRNFPNAARKQFKADSSFASDVLIEGSEVRIYYPKSETDAICLMWDTEVDKWSMSQVTQPSDTDNIDVGRGHAASSDTVWKSP